jgi:hypothetical protein
MNRLHGAAGSWFHDGTHSLSACSHHACQAFFGCCLTNEPRLGEDDMIHFIDKVRYTTLRNFRVSPSVR